MREIYRRLSRFKIWSLSPSDARLQDFLRSVSRMLPSSVHPKRNPSLSPNKTAIALWLEFGKTVAGWHWHRRCALGSAEALLKGLFNDLDPSCNDGDHPRALRHSFEVVFDQRLIEEVHLPANSRAETHSINIHEFEKMRTSLFLSFYHKLSDANLLKDCCTTYRS